jgi:hypothetical protein
MEHGDSIRIPFLIQLLGLALLALLGFQDYLAVLSAVLVVLTPVVQVLISLAVAQREAQALPALNPTVANLLVSLHLVLRALKAIHLVHHRLAHHHLAQVHLVLHLVAVLQDYQVALVLRAYKVVLLLALHRQNCILVARLTAH